MGGIIKSIEPGSVAEALGLHPGDELLRINTHDLRDVIDAQFYAADEALSVEFLRLGQPQAAAAARKNRQALGIEFEHPTFDIDIRRCNNLCPFCFVLQNAPKMRRTLYIKDDDYRYSFLFGHYVTLTNLSESDWARLAEQRLSPLYVSVHATDLAVRRECLRNPTAPDVVEQIKWLGQNGIEIHTQLVITPGVNDGPRLEESIRALAALHPTVLSVSVIPVGLTRHHKYGKRPFTADESRAIVDQVQAWQAEFQAALGTRFAFLTDEWYLVSNRPVPKLKAYETMGLQSNGLGMVRDFLEEWSRVRKHELGQAAGLAWPNRKALLATGALFAPTLAKTVAEFNTATGLKLEVMSMTNEALGDTITVAGLLAGADVIRQLQARFAAQPAADLPDVVVLPRLMFDHPDSVALDDVTPLAIAQAIGRPVALADWMGDVVDALAGENKLVFRPESTDLSVPVVREGGWAVEKYL